MNDTSTLENLRCFFLFIGWRGICEGYYGQNFYSNQPHHLCVAHWSRHRGNRRKPGNKKEAVQRAGSGCSRVNKLPLISFHLKFIVSLHALSSHQHQWHPNLFHKISIFKNKQGDFNVIQIRCVQIYKHFGWYIMCKKEVKLQMQQFFELPKVYYISHLRV